MDTMNRIRSRVTSSESWRIRTKRQKRVVQLIIVGIIVLCGIVFTLSLSHDTRHHKQSPENEFDPDYMLGHHEMMKDMHYNKRWRPHAFEEPTRKPSTHIPLRWEDLDSEIEWFHQRHRLRTTPTTTITTTTTTIPKTTTTTTTTSAPTTTTTTPAPTTTTTTLAPTTTTTIPVPTTTTTVVPIITTTTNPEPTTTTTMTMTTITPATTTETTEGHVDPNRQAAITTQLPTETVTSETTIRHRSNIFQQNNTSGVHSEDTSPRPSNTASFTTNPTEFFNSATTTQTAAPTTAPNSGASLGSTQRNKPAIVTQEATEQSNTLQNSTFPHVETSSETTHSVEENTEKVSGKEDRNNINFVQNKTRTTLTNDEKHSSNGSAISQVDDNFTVRTTSLDMTTLTPVTTSDAPQVFHLNASMSIESSIGSETIGSAGRRHHSEKVPTPKTTESSENVTSPQSNICLEDECLIVARKLNQSIDSNIGPCENFYQHVCGNGQQIDDPSRDFTNLRGTVLNPDIREDIKDLLIQPPLQYDSKAVKNVKTLYRSCVKRVTNNRVSLIFMQRAMSKLTNFIRKSKSGANGPDLGKLAIHLISLHSNYLFPISVAKDSMNVSRNLLHIGINKPLLLTKKNYESRFPYFNALRDLITDIANLMGVKSIVHKVLGFELLLAQITPENSEEFENEYNPTTIRELESSTKIPWRDIFQSGLDLTGENITIGLNETVIVQSKVYLKNLLELLRDSTESDLIDYTVIRFVLPKLDAMPKQFFELYQRYKKIISGIEIEDRHLSCVIFAGNMMPGLVGKIYSDRYFSEAVKYRNIHVPKMIHSTALELIKKLPWMDRPTKLKGLTKLYSMLQMIGNDDTLSGDPFINQFQFMDDHMKNLFILDKYQSLRTFSQLRTMNSRGKWAINSHPFEMTSFYSPQQNAIYIPAAMFQQPLFHDDLPLTMQFGALGSIVGHAYIHALDVIGSKFDDNGNLRNWWSNKTRKDFKSRIAALNSYTLQDFGERDIIESSADIGGVKISWRVNLNLTLPLLTKKGYSYESAGEKDEISCLSSFWPMMHVSCHFIIPLLIFVSKFYHVHKQKYKQFVFYYFGEALKKMQREFNLVSLILPGLNYTSDQLFYVNYARAWCDEITMSHALDNAGNLPNLPAKNRVIITLQNLPSFSESFNCKVGDYMNPKDKTQIW